MEQEVESTHVAALRWRADEREIFADAVVVEAPLAVHLNQGGRLHQLGSTMRTPGNDEELAVGLAVAEGVLKDRRQVLGFTPVVASTDAVAIEVTDDVRIDTSGLGRITRPTSACGVCGREEIDALEPIPVDHRAPALEVLAGLPEAMAAHQPVFERTGGLHAAAIAAQDGEIWCVREDVGRHNAVDKAVGFALMHGLAPAALVVSGRAGFEIVQKASAAGIPALVSVSATTSLAIKAAKATGITLACFTRQGSMTVYTEDTDKIDELTILEA